MTTSESQPTKGSDQGYCSVDPANEHFMVSHSGGQKVRWVERCNLCGWINAVRLDAWVDLAFKEALTARGARIAVATETEPFAFVQPSSGYLPLIEILTQALAASYALGQDDAEGRTSIDNGRMRQILHRLEAEVERAMEEAMDRRERAVREAVGSKSS